MNEELIIQLKKQLSYLLVLFSNSHKSLSSTIENLKRSSGSDKAVFKAETNIKINKLELDMIK